jgi:predicted RNase H-like HicB family nuclease
MGQPVAFLASSSKIPHTILMRKPAKRKFNVVVERDKTGYYVASVPELPGCHTQVRSLKEVLPRIREAILLYLDEGKDSSSE